MGRSESGEARAGSGGGSSAMPQKSNPVAAETIAALARLTAALIPPLHTPHAEERDGTAWSLEWLALPQVVVATGASLRHAQDLAATLAPDGERIAAALALDRGAVMAETARIRLSETRPRTEAERLVKQALTADEPLSTALARLAPGTDWRSVLDPASATGAAAAMADAIFATRRRP
jgi:3-carboxy-cis,cis-muconate cycloisomerase